MKITYKDKTIDIQEPQKVIDVFKNECNEHVIACICNKSKNVFGLMPHPERAIEAILGSDDGVKMLQGFID